MNDNSKIILIDDPRTVFRQKQPREKDGDSYKESLDELREDIRVRGLIQPIGVTTDPPIPPPFKYVLLFGDRRLECHLQLGIPIQAKMLNGLTDAEKGAMRFSENHHRASLTNWEKYLEFEAQIALNPSVSNIVLADLLKVSSGMISRYRAVESCLPVVQEALKADIIGIEDCYRLRDSAEAKQHEYVAARKNGVSRDQMKVPKKQRVDLNVPEEKPRRSFKSVIPGTGITMTFSGEGVTLVSAVKAAKGFLAEADDAAKRKINDCKVFSQILAERDQAIKEEARKAQEKKDEVKP